MVGGVVGGTGGILRQGVSKSVSSKEVCRREWPAKRKWNDGHVGMSSFEFRPKLIHSGSPSGELYNICNDLSTAQREVRGVGTVSLTPSTPPLVSIAALRIPSGNINLPRSFSDTAVTSLGSSSARTGRKSGY
jgi:hypothetical protein